MKNVYGSPFLKKECEVRYAISGRNYSGDLSDYR